MRKKLLAGGAGVLMTVGLAFAVLPPASASAATLTPNVLTLCSYGGYGSYMMSSSPQDGKLYKTTTVAHGTCAGFANQLPSMVYNVYDAANNAYLGSVHYYRTVGAVVTTTATSPYFRSDGARIVALAKAPDQVG
jgi:hypothetical protein